MGFKNNYQRFEGSNKMVTLTQLNKKESIHTFLNEWGEYPLAIDETIWGKLIASEPIKQRTAMILVAILISSLISFLLIVFLIGLYFALSDLFLSDTLFVRISSLILVMIFLLFIYFIYIFFSRVISPNIKTSSGLVMNIYEKGLFVRLGYFYKSPSKELSTEMFFPFNELTMIPSYTIRKHSNCYYLHVKLWEIWNTKYNFFGKLSPSSGYRLLLLLNEVLLPDEAKRIYNEYLPIQNMKKADWECIFNSRKTNFKITQIKNEIIIKLILTLKLENETSEQIIPSNYKNYYKDIKYIQSKDRSGIQY